METRPEGQNAGKNPGEPRQPAPGQLSEPLIKEILQLIEKRSDLIGAFHRLSPAQDASLKVFEDVARGMAVNLEGARTKETKPDLDRNLPSFQAVIARSGSGNALKVQVPPRAVRGRVYSTAGTEEMKTLPRDDAGDLLIPEDLRGKAIRIGRLEFYDAQNKLLGITGGEIVRKA